MRIKLAFFPNWTNWICELLRIGPFDLVLL